MTPERETALFYHLIVSYLPRVSILIKSDIYERQASFLLSNKEQENWVLCCSHICIAQKLGLM